MAKKNNKKKAARAERVHAQAVDTGYSKLKFGKAGKGKEPPLALVMG